MPSEQKLRRKLGMPEQEVRNLTVMGMRPNLTRQARHYHATGALGPAEGVVAILSAQVGYLLSGIGRRYPQETWRPTSVG